LTEHKETKTHKQNKDSRINAYARFSGIAFQMTAIIGLGSFGGVKLDQSYPNKYSVFTIICSLVSIGIAIYYVIKQVTDFSNKENNKK
jgi:F0F1-type ATP synthase assembly protein I